MQGDREGKLIRAAEALLERERDCLLAGDLGALAGLAAEKEALMARLGESGLPEAAAAAALREKAQRNQQLLDAALQGIRRVSARLGAYRQVRRSMETYDPQGRKETIAGTVVHRLERRA
ncbi:MAG: flagellar protein FlgN [Roseovarius sp.]|nr:flagellar protein FlgN [Roseovarius sp.]